MKPILIDAIYINMGGALTVLNRFIDGAVEAGLAFVLLKDVRCPKLRSEDGMKKIVVLPPSLWERHKYYKAHRNDFHSVLCMGNVPPTLRMPCKVHTYFHNLSVLMKQDTMPLKWRLKFFLKRFVIRLFARNTDSWVVQTWNTENLIKETLPWKGKEFYRYPIYTIPEDFKKVDANNKTDYLFVGEYTNAKGHDNLLEAWRILHDRGIDRTLHLTSKYPPFVSRIEEYKAKGVHLVNHGFIPFVELADVYHQSKAIVYPSLNESLGLGIVEGLHAGCDVIASDLPFTHSICKASEVFDPHSPESIAEAVKRYEKGGSQKSELTIHDCIKGLLDQIKK